MAGSWTPGTAVEENAYNWKGEPFIIRGSESPSDARPTVVDLFCGAGGFSVGFEDAGFRSLLATDIHPPSIKTFHSNHPATTMVVGDMRRVTDDLLREALGGRHVDVVAGGVPCQGFSLNNRKRWDADPRNFLFKEFIRVVRLCEPSVVLLENVSGIRSSGNGHFREAIARAIEESGYRVDCQVLNAAEHGVPQTRQRVFFMGVRPGSTIRWPFPAFGARAERPYLTVWDAIGDLPQIGPGEVAEKYDEKPFTPYQKEMRGKEKVLWNHQAPDHPSEVSRKIGRTKPGEPIYPAFPQRIRLHKERPSPTQVSGGIRPQYQFGHPSLPRGLTIRERCRLQSFPDRYVIHGGIVQGRVQTGNAVPPRLAQAVARQILAILRNEPPAHDSVQAPPSQLVLV